MEERIDIRPYAPEDAEALYDAVRESVDEISRWMPWCTPDYDLHQAREWIDLTIRGREEGTLYDFAVVLDGTIVGGCGINQINMLDRVANIGYWVRSSQAGKGIATAAVRKVIDWGWTHTELNRLEIVTAVGNEASQKVAEKVGAVREAVLRKRTMVEGSPSDAVMNSVVRSD